MARVDTISSGLNAGVRVGPTRRTEYLATSGSLALLVLVYRMAHASWLVAPDPAGPHSYGFTLHDALDRRGADPLVT